MDSAKERRSFHDIVSFLDEKVKEEKIRKGEKYYRGPTNFFIGLFYILAGLANVYAIFFLNSFDPATDASWNVIFGFSAVMAFLGVAVFFSDKETYIIPKAFWCWICGKDPEAS